MSRFGVRATNSRRALYNDLKDQAKYADKIVTPGYLRLEQSVQNTLTNVQFNVLENQGTQNVTERRLKLPDAFVVEKMTICIMKAGATTTASQEEIAVSQLHTFPNPTVFSAANEAANLMNLYNGYMSVRVNETVYIDSMDIMRFYRVSTSQQGAGPAVAIPRSEWNAPDYSFYEFTPTITLDGGASNYINLYFPSSINMSGTTSQNFVVCIARGFLIQNGSARGQM